MARVLEFLRSEDGPTAVEYAVLLSLILVSIIAAIGLVGSTTGGLYNNIRDELLAAGFGS